VHFILKPRLHDQFLCDNFSYFYVRNVFGRVDETANNCWCTWFLFKKYLWTAVSRAIKHGADTNYTFTNMAGEKIWHFMWQVIYTSNFSYVTTFICHIKANALAFQQLYLPHKNCPIFLVQIKIVTSKLSHKNCSYKRGFKVSWLPTLMHSHPRFVRALCNF
jgi:hypothetical protein